MSEAGDSPGLKFKKVFLRELKDRSLFVGWITGLVIIGIAAWALSRPLLASYLMRSVNHCMESDGTALRLSAPKSLPPVKQAPMGMWFSVKDSDDLFFVFSVFQNGILSVCGARLTPEYRVAKIMPLSAHARQIYARLPGGIMEMYSKRIESAAAQWRKNE
jgi:hypothetical protein